MRCGSRWRRGEVRDAARWGGHLPGTPAIGAGGQPVSVRAPAHDIDRVCSVVRRGGDIWAVVGSAHGSHRHPGPDEPPATPHCSPNAASRVRRYGNGSSLPGRRGRPGGHHGLAHQRRGAGVSAARRVPTRSRGDASGRIVPARRSGDRAGSRSCLRLAWTLADPHAGPSAQPGRRRPGPRCIGTEGSSMSTDESVLRAWAYLMRVAEPPHTPVCATSSRRRARSPPRRPSGRGRCQPVQRRPQRDKRPRRTRPPQLDLDAAAAVGARLVAPDDEEWPGWQLWGLRSADIVERGGPPWRCGCEEGCLADDVAAGIGVIGSRASTSYGEHVTGQIVGGLVDAGWQDPGGVFGIDGTAHRAALAAVVATVAVMAARYRRRLPVVALVALQCDRPRRAHRHRVIRRVPPRHDTASRRATVWWRHSPPRSSWWEAGAQRCGQHGGMGPQTRTSAGCGARVRSPRRCRWVQSMIADEQAALVVDAQALISPPPRRPGGPNRGPVRRIDELTGDRQRVRGDSQARCDHRRRIALNAALSTSAG